MKNSWTRIIFSVVLTNVLLLGMLGLVVWLDLMDDMETNFLFMHGMYSFVGILNSALILWLFVKVDKQNHWLLGFRVSKRDIIFSIVASLITLVAVMTFIWFLDRFEVVIAEYQFQNLLKGEFYQLLVVAIAGWFFAALKEEILARGYFMANLTRYHVPKMILLTAFLFMCMHFIMGDLDPFKAASWFKGGIVYGYIYVKSGSLTVATIVHTSHNLFNAMVIHGQEGAIVILNTKISTADKLIYELSLGLLLLGLTYLFYGKNGVFTPANNLNQLWRKPL